MAERSDITVDWGVFSRSSPRIITVGAPSTSLILQDLVDTIRSNTLGETPLDQIDDDALLGKNNITCARCITCCGDNRRCGACIGNIGYQVQ